MRDISTITQAEWSRLEGAGYAKPIREAIARAAALTIAHDSHERVIAACEDLVHHANHATEQHCTAARDFLVELRGSLAATIARELTGVCDPTAIPPEEWAQHSARLGPGRTFALRQDIDRARDWLRWYDNRTASMGQVVDQLNKELKRSASECTRAGCEELASLLTELQDELFIHFHASMDARDAEQASRRATKYAARVVRAMGRHLHEWVPTAIGALLAELPSRIDARKPAIAHTLGWMRHDDEERARILVLNGAPSLGKTVAAAAFVAERDASYIRSADLANESRAHYGGPSKRYRACVDARALVIDDFGARATGRDDHTEIDVVASVIDERLGVDVSDDDDTSAPSLHRLETVLITNLSRIELEEKLGLRTAERLAEAAVFIEVRGESMRRRQPPAPPSSGGKRTTTAKDEGEPRTPSPRKRTKASAPPAITTRHH